LAATIDRIEQSAAATLGDRIAEVLNSVADGITVQDASGRLVYANEPAVRIIGFSSVDELLQESNDDFLARFELYDERGQQLPPGSLPGRVALAGEEAEPMTVRFRARATGDDRWARVRAAALRDAEGRVAFVVNTFNEITDTDELIGAQRSLHDAEAQLNAIFESVLAGVAQTDVDGRFLLVNDRFAEITGRTTAELYALRFQDIVHPDDLEHRLTLLEGLIKHGRPFVIEKRYLRPGGEVVWVRDSVSATRGEDGRVTSLVVISNDISAERRTAEEARRARGEAEAAVTALSISEGRFRSLVTATSDVIWTAELDGRMVARQPAWEAFTGQSFGEYRDLGWLDAVHPDDRAERERLIGRTRNAPDYFETSYRLRGHDGVYRRVLVKGVPIRSESGTVREFVGSVTDVEDQQRALERLQVLARVSKALDVSLDPEETVKAAARSVVRDFADWSVIDLIQPDGTVRRAAVVTADPDKEAIAQQLTSHPLRLGDDTVGAIAIREERAVLLDAVTPEMIRERTDGPEHAALVEQLGAHSVIAAPLRARERVLGAMFFVVSSADRMFDAQDIELATELGNRAGLAIANAQLHTQTQRALAAAEVATRRTERLRLVGSALADARSQAEAARIALREVLLATDAAGGQLAVVRGDVLVTEAIEGYPDELVEAERRIPLDADHPTAGVARAGEPAWIPSVPDWVADQPLLREAAMRSGHQAAAILPLSHENGVVGLLSLSWREARPFDDAERTFLLAFAGQTAQALVRLALLEAREILFADLEAQRARLETVLAQMPSGVLIADRNGELVMANGRAAEIWRSRIPTGRGIGDYPEFVAFDATGRRLADGDWPLVQALRTGETVSSAELEIVRFDGTRGWIVNDAAPVRDGGGRVVAAVSVISDVTERRQAATHNAFLAEVSAVLASSLDYEETIARVAELAVPRIADWCSVDLIGDDGEPHQVAIAHVDPAKVALATSLRQEYPPDPDASRGIRAVIRTGHPDVMTDVPPEMVEAAARDDRHRDLLRSLGIRSYVCTPLVWEGRTLGALSFVGAESGRRYSEADLVFAQDVADRVAAAIQRARLFRDADRLRQILDTIADTTMAIDPATLRFTYANQGAVDQLGYPREELLAMGALDIIVDVDEPAFRDLIAPLLEGGQEARTVTQSYRTRDGRLIPVEILLQYVATLGEPARIVTVARDITDRVEAQARLQRLAESEHARAAELNAVLRALGEGVIVCGPDGRISLANPAAEEIFAGAEPSTYAGVLALLDDPEHEAPALGVQGDPIVLRAKGPDDRWIELSTWPVESRRDPSGATETIVMLRDVTTARQRQIVRDTFVGVLSHELRTPVTTIFAGAKLLARDASTIDRDVRQSVFEDIHGEAERLHRLVEDVVALTRFGEEDLEIGQEPVLIQRILPNVVRSEEIRWPGISFRVRMPTGLPTVSADPTYVEQVVRNLLSNAAKYGGPEPVTVEAEAGEDEVQIRILDDGPGFESDEAPRLFELFYRSPSTAGRAAGAGIGLYVCARLMQAMGGRIWANPRPAGGAEFGIALRIMGEE
jgi:PAS domain S-box-containing protein